MGKGNKLNTMASTTMFSVGELSMVASADSLAAPEAYNPCAMGATQFEHTPSGTPVSVPQNTLA